MQKTKTKLLTALLLSLFAVSMMPFAAFASTGYIRINPTDITTVPLPSSPVGQQVQAGGNVSLFFGGVSFSGGQFNLYIGPTGFSQISTGAQADVQYTPTFDLAALQANAVTQIPGNAQFPGQWSIGFGWVNGTIKQDLPGGSFFIKAFDGTSTSVAVTDTSVTITGNIFIIPSTGNAGQTLTISGYAFLANSLVNVTYSSITLGANKVVASLLQTGSLGNFTITIPAPDIGAVSPSSTNPLNLAPGAQTPTSQVITFAGIQNSTGATFTATYTEYSRGLAQARVTGTGGAQMTVPAGTLLGNGTTLSFSAGVAKTLRFAGNYFYPGALTTRFDNAAITNTAPTINGTGWFNSTLTIPPTTNGVHNITFTDGNGVVFVVFVNIAPSLVLSPTSGPVGTTVTATGYGFTAPTAAIVNNATLFWNAGVVNIGSAFVDATGTFTATFVVPSTVGGANTVNAYENFSGVNSFVTSAQFTVVASFVVIPDTFVNNASLLANATGTGFKPGSLYFPNIDNQMLGMGQQSFWDPAFPNTENWQTGVKSDSNGFLSIMFVRAGFQPGTHVFSLYENGTTTPISAGFTVTGDVNVASTNDLLNQINQTTIQTNSTVNSISTNVNSVNANINALNTTINTMNTRILAINGTVVTLQTSMGSVTTSISTLSASITSITGNMATLQTSMGSVTTTVNSLSASISSINSGVATIQTTLGTMTTKLNNLDAVLGAVAGQLATVQTSLGTVTTSLTSLGTTINGISTSVTGLSTDLAALKAGDIATIKTDLGTIKGTVTSNANGIATIQTTLGTIQTNVGSLQTDVTSTKSSTDNLSPLVIVAIVLALIAAIAAIASIVMMRRKIAG